MPYTMTQIALGGWVVDDSYTGEYRFFPHSDPAFFISLNQVSEQAYRSYVLSKVHVSDEMRIQAQALIDAMCPQQVYPLWGRS
jgi:hypothetical protein